MITPTELVDQGWYKKLLEDIKLHTNIKIVEAKHYLGKRVTEAKEKAEATYGSYFIEQLAEDLQLRRQDIYECLEFYRRYPKLSDTVGQLSWRYIVHKLLPAPKKRKFQPPAMPDKKYGLIYADPPWEYDTPESTKAVDDHYPVLNKQELCWMGDRVQAICAENCTLYLWATTARLNWAFPVLEAWGFKYLTSMVWDKVGHNLGWYCSANHEILLIAGKGSSRPRDTKLANSVDSVQVIPKSKIHSQKPIEFRGILEQLYPEQKRIILFPGLKEEIPTHWDFWPKDIQSLAGKT